MMEVLQAGLCDLVMGSGRPGLGALGVPVGGASDPAALAAANALAGNPAAAAGLEITLAGPTLRFPQGAIVALTGAHFTATRSCGAPVAWNETLVLAPEETLAIGRVESGCRCWLALQGGLAVPQVLGSHSTFLPAGFGGYRGRALQAGDTLDVGVRTGELHVLRAIPPDLDGMDAPLRVVAGPQVSGFKDVGLAAFFGSPYRVEAASDRRGMRLAGLAVRYAGGELSSQGVLPGAVQVPPDGQPIILGWDGPVTGGYPVIAGVISADWARLAQLKPGDAVRFETVEVERARAWALTAWKIEELA
ncbi:MAG: allophanate hydrolase [Hydrogenophilales bacterium 17-61-9]|nr:MAG: allophanate hydrolase [Hydrogenophilales bacterium 17-61-9]